MKHSNTVENKIEVEIIKFFVRIFAIAIGIMLSFIFSRNSVFLFPFFMSCWFIMFLFSVVDVVWRVKITKNHKQ